MIQLKNISKAYKENKLYENYSLTIAENEFVAIVGASGKGKSTLLNIMGLLEPIDSGTQELAGVVNPKGKQILKLQRETIGYLFQNYGLIEDETVKANLLIAMSYQKMSRKMKQLAIDEVLAQVGLAKISHKYIHQLSGGEQQRIAIARLLLKKPRVIFADEPTGNLDEQNRDTIFLLLQQLQQQTKATLVMVTHDEILAKQCDRLIRL
ncbi:MAG: ABC transporter ATP-binding protein [Culicoidibacterales bacterium]